MLVLNRRSGESIIIEPDVRAMVLSIEEGRVWFQLHGLGTVSDLRLSATVVSVAEARLEIGPLVSVDFDAAGVRLRSAPTSHPAAAMQAGLSISRRVGERVEIDDEVWIEIGTLPKGNPSVAFGGVGVGEPFTLAVIRPSGSYVRIGVDAPNRRVYREELWDAVRMTKQDAGAEVPAETLAEAAPG